MKCKKCGKETTPFDVGVWVDNKAAIICSDCYFKSPTQLTRFKEFFDREGYKCKTSKYYDTTRLSILVQDKSFTTFHEACFYFDKEGKLVK